VGGHDDQPPARLIDWQGKAWTPEESKKAGRLAAHPNARFTVSASQCPSMDANWKIRKVCRFPLSCLAVVAHRPCRSSSRRDLGGRRVHGRDARLRDDRGDHRQSRRSAPRPYGHARVLRIQHGRLLRALAQDGAQRAASAKIFRVNWFRRDAGGKFLWPGFGENMRVLQWIFERCRGRAPGVETPLGEMPRFEDLDWRGLEKLSPAQYAELERIGRGSMEGRTRLPRRTVRQVGKRLPSALEARRGSMHEKLA